MLPRRTKERIVAFDCVQLAVHIVKLTTTADNCTKACSVRPNWLRCGQVLRYFDVIKTLYSGRTASISVMLWHTWLDLLLRHHMLIKMSCTHHWLSRILTISTKNRYEPHHILNSNNCHLRTPGEVNLSTGNGPMLKHRCRRNRLQPGPETVCRLNKFHHQSTHCY